VREILLFYQSKVTKELTSQYSLNGKCDKPPTAIYNKHVGHWLTGHSRLAWGQHCWASQPVPDKYTFQATDKRTNRMTSLLH